jgi:hypothetical protein
MGGACSMRRKKCVKVGKPAGINHMDNQGGDNIKKDTKDI